MAVREDLTDINDGRYSNVLLLLFFGVMLYIIARGWNQAKAQTLSDNIGSNDNARLAQQLRQAFIPSGFPVAMGFDGTDVTAVMSIAAQIRDYNAVAASYRTLYNADLSNDLSEELSVDALRKFWALVNQKTTNTTTTAGSSSTGSITVIRGGETIVSSLSGKTCVANQTVNVRLYDKPQYTDHQAVKGDNVGKYAGEVDLTINGSKGRFVHVKKAAVWGLYNVSYLIYKGSLTFV